ncbi:MAG: hypothetical protein ACOC5B_03785, partial [Myxococcota bacterium]
MVSSLPSKLWAPSTEEAPRFIPFDEVPLVAPARPRFTLLSAWARARAVFGFDADARVVPFLVVRRDRSEDLDGPLRLALGNSIGNYMCSIPR